MNRERLPALFTAVCPGEKACTLLAVWRDNEGSLMLGTTRYAVKEAVDHWERDLTVPLPNGGEIPITLSGSISADTPFADSVIVLTLSGAPQVWHLRCCRWVYVETEWVTRQIDAGTHRAVVPDSMLMSGTL